MKYKCLLSLMRKVLKDIYFWRDIYQYKVNNYNILMVTGDYPWQGSHTNFGSHTCGCVLISEDWVLTAGHCIGGG
jgi:hypothetical protein